jgi:hypothetical protein
MRGFPAEVLREYYILHQTSDVASFRPKNPEDLFRVLKEQAAQRSIDPLEREIDVALLDYFRKNPAYRDLRRLGELKSCIYKTLSFNRRSSWSSVFDNVSLVASVDEFLEVMQLRARRYRDMGYDQVYTSDVPGLDYDEHDTHSYILCCRHNGEIIASERVIVKTAGKLLPSEELYNARNGLTHIARQCQQRSQTYAEKSRLVIAANSIVSGPAFKKLFASTYYLAGHEAIGNYIALCTEREYRKNYQRFGMIAEKTGRFFEELEEPDAILSWDLELQVSRFFERAILGQGMRRKTRRTNQPQPVAA